MINLINHYLNYITNIFYNRIYNDIALLYHCGRIFFILSFFVGYILSFGLVRLRTVWLSAGAGAGAHTECSSRSRAEDVTITNVIIKITGRKWDWGVNDVMPGREEMEILVIFEKNQLAEIRTKAKPVQLVYRMRCAFVGSVSWDSDSGPRVQLGNWLKGYVGTVSIVKNCVSLSSCRKPKSQEGNRSFVPELKKVVSVSRISGYLCICICYSPTFLYYEHSKYFTYYKRFYHIYQPLRSGRIWHKVNF